MVDSRGGNKRKRGNLWMSFIDPENPHDRERKNGVPVGLKNIGNTCWFSAVIQVCTRFLWLPDVVSILNSHCSAA